MHHDALYMLAVMAHLASVIFGMYVVAQLENVFQKSHPSSVLNSPVERHFWTLVIAFTVNAIAIWQIIPRWASGKHIVTNDLVYVVNHILVGLLCVMFHTITLAALKEHTRGKAVGNG